MAKRNPGDPIIIKKYANRRLYDTSTSSYVTLEHLARLIREGKDFVVQDAKSGEDLTRSVLAQIIFEEENKGTSMLPVNFLRQVIRFYGDQMQSVLPAYLDMSMNSFAAQQEKFREQMRSMGGFTPMAMFEEMARRNMAMFEQTIGMFQPGTTRRRPAETAETADEVAENAGEEADEALSLLKEQMAAMQAQLDKLAKKGGKA
jgi:polyhydroxyalkanoate synthesis repressor PhaR